MTEPIRARHLDLRDAGILTEEEFAAELTPAHSRSQEPSSQSASRSIVLLVAAIVLAGLYLALSSGIASVGIALVLYVPYVAVGALLAIRRPRNLIGWLLIAIGWALVGGTVAVPATAQSLRAGTASPLALVIAWVTSFSWFVAFALFVIAMIIFPASVLPTGRWRRPAAVAIALALLGVVLIALAPTITVNHFDGPGAAVTIGGPLAFLPDTPPWSWLDASVPVGGFLLTCILIGSAGSMIVRARRSSGLERQQLRWLVAALSAVTAAQTVGVILSLIFGDAIPDVAYAPVLIAFVCVPISIGIAVLRYRLYQIETIINRAVLYGAVTVVILAVFGLANIGLQRMLESLTGQRSELLTGALGVGVALAYGPMRRRVRPLVDRFLPGRALLALLFIDIVESTEHLVELGDERWRMLLGRYRATVRRELARHGGHEVDTAGDSFFATFERPTSGVSCALAIRDAVNELGLQLRTGLHLGECEMRGEEVTGIEVHKAARVMAAAAEDEILLSAAVRDAISDSDFPTTDRGSRELKGVPGAWQLFALDTTRQPPASAPHPVGAEAR